MLVSPSTSHPFITYLPQSLLLFPSSFFNSLTGIMQFSVITYPDTSKELYTENFDFHQTPFSLPSIHEVPLQKTWALPFLFTSDAA